MLDLILIIVAFATGGGGDGMASAPDPAKPPASEVVEQAETTEPINRSVEAPPPSGEKDPTPKRVLPYKAEQQVATGRFLTALEIKPIMGATRNNWIAVREFNGQDLVYVTHIWSWRCGLVASHIGINGAEPEPWPLPKCHEEMAAPNAMLPDDGLPYRAFPLGSVETVTVELIYDDLTTEKVTFNRQGALIP